VPRFQDITTVTKEAFIEKTGQETITLISGGFPCQPFSAIGPKQGFSDPRYLWPEMCRVIKELRPRWVLGENVANFINMGLHKTLFDLEQAGYAVWTFVLPACAVGAWHERKRTFIVGADVSHAPCFRHRLKGKCGTDKYNAGRSISQTEKGRDILDTQTVGNHLFSHTDPGFDFTLQPGMGGMADGLPTGVDGNLLWGIEPADIPRLAPDKKDRAKRLKTLGNAVVPAQVYPILRYIADIELGRCREWCVFSENGGAGLSSN
jgi:DNA (cytosine-5)-methyltransferase 1